MFELYNVLNNQGGIDVTLGELIIEYREKHKLSQRQFATVCGLTNGFISMLEANRNPKTGKPISPSFASLKSLASAMHISLQELLEVADDTEISFDTDDIWSQQFKNNLSNRIEAISRADASEMHLDISYLHQVIDDGQAISLDTACAIADALGVSLDEMVDSEERGLFTSMNQGISELDVELVKLLQSLPEEKKSSVVEYLRFLSGCEDTK